ncbi:MAG: PPC domain-containing protein, partial [Anaerolineae bacterium]|nr:PPC domain-containing protein [Anaerolineae bacterium]
YTATELVAVAQPIALEETLGGFIGNDQQYQTYAFEGLANQIVSINVFASSGSLDTYTALLDANGSLITFNDDLAVGVTDSSINAVLLPTTGTYYVVVSRYAKDIGGTEGEYTVTVTEQATNLSDTFLALPDGNLEVLLLWNTNADLQLLVRDASGDSVYDDIPRIASGGQLAAQGNVNCRVSDGTPFSYIYWPPERQPRPGSYEVEVWFQSECNDTSPVTFNLYVTLNGREVLRASESPIFLERYLTSFTINADGTATPSDGGIIRGIETLDYLSELEAAHAANVGEPRAGSITPTNKFDVYTYDGAANETLTIALNATSGTLDTVLYVVSPSGALVAENDDAVPGENTNSLISDFILPEDGQYIIIVTHYGALYGGTTGTYTLTLAN